MSSSSKGNRPYSVYPRDNYWLCDGDFFYVAKDKSGLCKFSTNSHGRMAGRAFAENADYQRTDVSMMLYDGKLYVRYKELAPEPFIVLDKHTLREVDVDPDQDYEPEEGGKSIHWTERDEDTGRSLAYTPLITDGKHVYVIARYFESKEQKEARAGNGSEPCPDLVVEVYDPSDNFRFIRQVTLYYKDGEKFKY